MPDRERETERETERERDHPEVAAAAVAAADLLLQRLFRARTIVISGEINQRLAASITAQLLALASESEEPITVYLNSQGGHVEAGDTIHDMVRFVRAPVRMVGTGWVAS